MIWGLVDLARVTSLENALPRSWYSLRTNLSVWPIVPLFLRYRAQILLECFLWHWFKLPIGLPYFLTFGNKFDIKYFTWCIAMPMMHACMTQKYEMTCYARKCMINYDLMYALWRQGKHISNLIRFFANFLVESYYLDHLLFKQAFFVKSFFWSFSTWYIFFNNTFLF